MKAIQVRRYGGPERLEYGDRPKPAPRAGEALVRLQAIGVNFIDIYQRTGLYEVELPFVPGLEAAGRVEEIGEPTDASWRPKIGDRVAYTGAPGAYAEYGVVPIDRLVPLPDGVSLRQAAALMVQGMTAHYLAYDTYRLGPEDTALIHAAAGGVGLLLVQIATARGARVIATVSTVDKERLVREQGADEVIRYTETDFEQETRRLTGGAGVSVVYDSVGRDTFQKSLRCLRRRGWMVSYGQSSGAVDPMTPHQLSGTNSLFFTRPNLFDYVATREELLRRTADLFGGLTQGSLHLRIDRSLPLAEARQAHELLASRGTAGKLLLLPA